MMELTIPLLACKSLDELLDFYEALGFEITYRQEQPYIYAAVRQGKINLHFSKRAKKTICLVFVPSVATYHREFTDALRAKYGKIPTANFPRISRLKPGQTRFYLFDPSENALIYINQDEPDPNYVEYKENLSPLAQALQNAIFLRDTYADDKAAARVLDLAIGRHSIATPIDRALALATRAELAVAMGETARSQAIQSELRQIPLTEEDQTRFQDELQAAEKLEQWLI